MPSSGTRLVGVTGGIGSGKSAVCRCFAELGRAVLSADAIARTLTEEAPDIRAAIARRFGAGIYGPDGHLKRKELAASVFVHPAELRALNGIVHPRVFETLDAEIARLDDGRRRPYVIIEAALVFESGMDRRLDATILVRAPVDERIARVARRDGLAPEEVAARMRAQIPEADASRRAGFVIDNGGEEGELREKVAFLDRLFTRLYGA